MIGLDGSLDTTRRGPQTPLDRVGLAGSDHLGVLIVRAEGADLTAYWRLRHEVFVDEQGLFAGSDLDGIDGEPSTVVLVARDSAEDVVGGVRLSPVGGDVDAGWWAGSRLVVRSDHRRRDLVGAGLVRAACAVVEEAGALRFDATVQRGARRFFEHLGWVAIGDTTLGGQEHVRMRWPIERIAQLVSGHKSPLGGLLAGLDLGGPGWVGDDAAPVPASDLVVACDSILASMVERDPWWAGWCGALVNVNDVAAMGAEPVGLLDALSAPSLACARRVLAGLRGAADAFGVPILGGHTSLGVPPGLSVTALGRTTSPVPGGGGRPGDVVRVSLDLGGSWRPGYRGRQWDSSTSRSRSELSALVGLVAARQPAAAKDVSMGGLVGSLGMLAEASGCGAELFVSAVPRPVGVSVGDWLTCFPGFGMVCVQRPGRGSGPRDASPATTSACGRLVDRPGVTLVWPDGETTLAFAGAVTGLGPAR